MKKTIVFIPVLLIIALGQLSAQDVKFTASATKVVRVGERFNLSYTSNQDISDLELPQIDGFTVLGGPYTSSSSSIQIINGQMTKSSTNTYTYTLQANKTGEFIIPPAKAKYKRKTYESNAVKIEVVQGSASSSSSSSSSSTQQPKSQSTPSPSGITNENLFVRLVVDKKNVVIGEPITAWFKLYTRVQVSDYDERFSNPPFTGFFKEDVEIPPLRSLERENVGGEIYNSGVMRKVILYPQKSGALTIDPYEVTIAVQQQVQRRSRSIFDDFFSSPYRTVQVKVKSKPVKINVKSLPGGKPSTFSGAVGNYTIKSSIDKTEVLTNDAITYKVSISGTGNVKLINPPALDFPPSLEVFEPKVSTQVNKTTGNSGRISFEYIIIPRHAGDFAIPEVSFTYFDLGTKAYKTLKTQDYDIHVEKGEGDTAAIVISGLSKEEVELLEKDIRYIKTAPRLIKASKYKKKNGKIYYYYPLTFLLTLLILILRREQIKHNADIARVRNKKASRYASKRLRKANKALKSENKEIFYEEVLKAIWGYISDKLNIPVADLSKTKAEEQLISKEVPKELIDEVFTLIDTCEYARYAPGGGTEDMHALYRKSAGIIGKIQQKIKS